MYDVLGIGNAIVDILALVDDDFLNEHNLNKSTMHLTDQTKQNLILKDLDDPTIASGGSVANTIATVAQLGLHSAFIGQTTDDKWGQYFDKGMLDIGVYTRLNILPDDGMSSSGTSVILITPDGERTMNTHLGVSSLINVACLNRELLENSKIVYLEGYLYDTAEAIDAINHAVEIAHESGSKIALSLSDSFCVDRHRHEFKKLISHVDILLANEAEICSLFEIENQILSKDMICQFAVELPSLVAITQSERGVTLISNQNVTCIGTSVIENPKDLTGAGDQFAAGFLYGISNEWSAEKSTMFGIELASEIIDRIGPRFEHDKFVEKA